MTIVFLAILVALIVTVVACQVVQTIVLFRQEKHQRKLANKSTGLLTLVPGRGWVNADKE
jgi:hypothetical protein